MNKNKILKYIVPKNKEFLFNNEKIIYCQIVQTQELKSLGKKIYKVYMINNNNYSNIFLDNELKELNIIDKIKLRRKKWIIN